MPQHVEKGPKGPTGEGMEVIDIGEGKEKGRGMGPMVEIGVRTKDRKQIGTDHHLHIGNIT